MSATTGAVGGKERAGGANPFLIVLLIVAILVALADFIFLTYKANQDAKAGALVTHVQVLSQQLSKQANDAAGGNIDAFKSLEQTRNLIDDLLKKFKAGDPGNGMVGYGDEANQSRNPFDRAWAQLNTDATKIRRARSRCSIPRRLRRLQQQDAGAQLAHGGSRQGADRKERLGRAGDDLLA
jgi:twitching motility protein PilJ